MIRTTIFLLLASLFLFACEKPEPNPEVRDQIYQDFLAQKGQAEKELADAEKMADDFKAQAAKAEPQTGQFKSMRKKYYEASHRVDQLKQQIKYWEIHTEERLISSRLSYLRAFGDKKPWPDPQEYETYKSQKKLRSVKMQWDQKERVKGTKMGSASAPPAAGGEGGGGEH